MAVFAISDLHLSLNSDKPMDVFGSKWNNYTEKMAENWNKIVKSNDLVVIPGDISWAMYLEDAEKDLEYINNLNGQKLLLRGNHDYWWTTLNKMENFVEEKGFSTINFLKNTAFVWNDVAVCGSRGWTIAHSGSSDEDKKIYQRERQRLILSLEDAIGNNCNEIIVAMHFPPIEQSEISEGFLDIFKNFGISRCVYGHLHAGGQKAAPRGMIDGIKLELVSCDYLDFIPSLIIG